MPRVLLVTNDYPPTLGGIQSYLRDFLATLPAEDVVVFASTQDAEAARSYDAKRPYRVYRWPRKVMLPTSATAREMSRIIAAERIDVVWFGAAAPLGLMGRAAKKAGATRVVATTHGHEVGWSMLPIARQLLRAIGSNADVITYISSYTLGRFRRAFGPNVSWAHLPSGVDVERFFPVDEERQEALRRTLAWGQGPYVVCSSRLVPRKGQDMLVDVWPQVRSTIPGATLVLIGGGPYEKKLRARAQGVDGVNFAGRVSEEELVASLQAADLFAMPARTRGKGLDVEGLGIVYLEAQACGIPVIAGNSGGAPETVTAETGVVVDGRDKEALANAVIALLGEPGRRKAMGEAGRAHVCAQWTWGVMGARLRKVLGYR